MTTKKIPIREFVNAMYEHARATHDDEFLTLYAYVYDYAEKNGIDFYPYAFSLMAKYIAEEKARVWMAGRKTFDK